MNNLSDILAYGNNGGDTVLGLNPLVPESNYYMKTASGTRCPAPDNSGICVGMPTSGYTPTQSSVYVYDANGNVLFYISPSDIDTSGLCTDILGQLWYDDHTIEFCAVDSSDLTTLNFARYDVANSGTPDVRFTKTVDDIGSPSDENYVKFCHKPTYDGYYVYTSNGVYELDIAHAPVQSSPVVTKKMKGLMIDSNKGSLSGVNSGISFWNGNGTITVQNPERELGYNYSIGGTTYVGGMFMTYPQNYDRIWLRTAGSASGFQLFQYSTFGDIFAGVIDRLFGVQA